MARYYKDKGGLIVDHKTGMIVCKAMSFTMNTQEIVDLMNQGTVTLQLLRFVRGSLGYAKATHNLEQEAQCENILKACEDALG